MVESNASDIVHASLGDVNGDGYADALVATRSVNGTTTISCYAGESAGLAQAPTWEWSSLSPSAYYTIDATGDVNGDGFSDLVIAGESSPELFLGSPYGLPANPSFDLPVGDLQAAMFEDIDCDGIDDIVVSGRVSENLSPTATVYRWSTTGSLELVGSVVGSGEALYSGAADTLRGAYNVGDVNGDGCGDVLLIGQRSPSGSGIPRISLFPGGTAGLAPTPIWIAGNGINGVDEAFLALPIADAYGDGFDDFIVADIENGPDQQEQLITFSGTAQGPIVKDQWQGRPRWGTGVTGDVNGDGYVDALLNNGATWTLYIARSGSPPGPFDGAASAWTADGDGRNVAIGDVNGDGCNDLLILDTDGATLYAGGSLDQKR